MKNFSSLTVLLMVLIMVFVGACIPQGSGGPKYGPVCRDLTQAEIEQVLITEGYTDPATFDFYSYEMDLPIVLGGHTVGVIEDYITIEMYRDSEGDIVGTYCQHGKLKQ